MGLDLVYTAVPETAAVAVASASPSMITVKLKGERLTPNNLKQLETPLEKMGPLALVTPAISMGKHILQGTP